jgi:hypothetical protein
MAFRKAALLEIGGFDPQFRSAGDDVDVCWRLQDRGWTIGFNPAAMVWHHRRNSVRMYWKQQKGYGKAEALLEAKWPEKYNAAGHLSWSGRLYGNGLTRVLGFKRQRIYHGTWGGALFQSIYEPSQGMLWSLPLMPEWYLLTFAFASMAVLGFSWKPLFVGAPLFVLTAGALLIQAVRSAAHASFRDPGAGLQKFTRYGLTAILHLAQPLARLIGRLRHGLTVWRRRGHSGWAIPRPHTSTIWSEDWQSVDAWLSAVEVSLRADGAVVRRGGNFDRWDLEVRGGMLGGVRTRMALEEHGSGKQLLRFRTWPRFSLGAMLLSLTLGILSIAAALDRSELASVSLGLFAISLSLRLAQECSAAMFTICSALDERRSKRVYDLRPVKHASEVGDA